jgi:putative transposase
MTHEGSVANRRFSYRHAVRYAAIQQRWRGGAVVDCKGAHFEKEIILWGVRWYVAYPISYRQLEERREERGGQSITPPSTAG